MKALNLILFISVLCHNTFGSIHHPHKYVNKSDRNAEQAHRLTTYANYMNEMIKAFDLDPAFTFDPAEDIKEVGVNIYSGSFSTDELLGGNIKLYINNPNTGESCQLSIPTVYNNVYLSCIEAGGKKTSRNINVEDLNETFVKDAKL